VFGALGLAGSISVAPTMDWEGILTSDSFSEMLGRAYSVSEEHGAGTRGVQGFASYNIDLSKPLPGPLTPLEKVFEHGTRFIKAVEKMTEKRSPRKKPK